MTSHSNLRGIASMVFAAGAFVANDSCMKQVLADDIPPLLMLTMRGCAALLWCVPLIYVMGLQRHLPQVFSPWIFLRSFSEVAAILCFVYALNFMPLANLTAIVQITPLLVLAGAVLFFGDHIGAVRWALIGIGIVGALLVAQPGSSAATPLAIFGFLTAIGAAARDIISRKVPPAAPGLIVALAALLWVMVTSAVAGLALETWHMPPPRAFGLMLVGGMFLMCGHLFIFLAFRLAPTRAVAPFSYAFTVWAVIAGVLLFDEVPNRLAVIGMGVIFLAGLLVILMERQTRTGEPA